jgi:AcrR family transcriptional regulator
VSGSRAEGAVPQRLLEAAYEVLIDGGYHTATVQRVARRAQLSTGAIYAHFANKHELFVLAVLDRWSRSPEVAPLDLGERAGDGGRTDDLELDDLVDLLTAQLSASPAAEHRVLTEVAGAAVRNDVSRKLLQRSVETIRAATRRAVDRAKTKGTISSHVPTDVVVALVVNLYLGAVTSKSFDLPQPGREDLCETFRLFRRRA